MKFDLIWSQIYVFVMLKFGYEWPSNRYSIRYISLIESAVAGKWSEYDGYTEGHHIIPLSFGGSNDRRNIAKLPGWLHYQAHYWLMKIFPTSTREGRSMIAAFRAMNISKYYQPRPMNSRLYDELRQLAAIAGSNKVMSDREKAILLKAKLGIPRSAETKARISRGHIGKKLSEDHKRKISEGGKGRKDSLATKEQRAAHHRGAIRSEASRQNMRDGRRLARERRERHLLDESQNISHTFGAEGL